MRVLAAQSTAPRDNPIAQALTLQGHAIETGLGDTPQIAAALHARIVALDKWTVANDPTRQSNAQAVIEAVHDTR